MVHRCVLLLALASAPAAQAAAFDVVEADIADMQRAMRAGRVSSHELVTQSLVRIATYEDRYNAVVSVNPTALAEARERDHERARGRIRGPSHGVPVALKDSILTTHLPTTANALAFAGYVPPYEATLVTRLREAGAIVIAKTTLTELANWVAAAPTPMPANYGSLTAIRTTRTIRAESRAKRSPTGAACSRPAARAPASVPH